MASTPATLPGTAETQDRTATDVDWTNASNITAEASAATCVIDATNPDTFWLKARNFGFNVKTVPVGFEVTVNHQQSGAFESLFVFANLFPTNDPDLFEASKVPATFPGTSAADETLGGPSDLWGRSWTAAEVNSSNFGIGLAYSRSSGTSTISVFYIKIIIYFPGAQRVTKTIAVVDGDVFEIESDGSGTLATNGNNALALGNVFAQPAFGKIYFADGLNFKRWEPATNTVEAWTASAGSLFQNSVTQRPRLIQLHGGSIWLSGVDEDEHNWIRTAQGDPTDFDTGASPVTDLIAVSGSASEVGLVGDVVTSLVSFNDDYLMFGCDHSLHRLDGNPAAGGRIQELSDVTGMAWGRPYTRDEEGIVYFFGSVGGVFAITPNQMPLRISSDRIEGLLRDVNTATHNLRLMWDSRLRGLHVWVTELDAGTDNNHFFWRKSDASWWPVEFATARHNPIAVHLRDADSPTDRQILLGGQDGKIRRVDDAVLNDDGVAIDASVVVGPVRAKGRAQFIFQELQVILTAGSDDVVVDFFVGETPEAAFARYQADTTDFTETISAGRSNSIRPEIRTYAAYVRFKNNTVSESFALEQLQATIIETMMTRIF